MHHWHLSMSSYLFYTIQKEKLQTTFQSKESDSQRWGIIKHWIVEQSNNRWVWLRIIEADNDAKSENPETSSSW